MMKTTVLALETNYISAKYNSSSLFDPSASADKHYCSTWSISTNSDQCWTKAVTIHHYSPLFALFAIRHYSLFAIRVFQTPLLDQVEYNSASNWTSSSKDLKLWAQFLPELHLKRSNYWLIVSKTNFQILWIYNFF